MLAGSKSFPPSATHLLSVAGATVVHRASPSPAERRARHVGAARLRLGRWSPTLRWRQRHLLAAGDGPDGAHVRTDRRRST